MNIDGKTFDDLLRKLYPILQKSTDTFEAKKGKGHDILAAHLKLVNPRSRISASFSRGKLFSALGEFCWYMSGSDKLEDIEYYIPNYPATEIQGGVIEAYGPRLMGTGGAFGRIENQFSRIVTRLNAKPDTRRAVISILESGDLCEGAKEAPCTSTLQFICRRNNLHMISNMRSNDAYLGLPHDLFCFTMMQELVARAIGASLGHYHHFAASLHLYDRNFRDVQCYIAEGFQTSSFQMPEMPRGCQLKNLEEFLKYERRIRIGELEALNEISLPSYWKDLCIVLLFYRFLNKLNDKQRAYELTNNLSSDFYLNFLSPRPVLVTPETKSSSPTQLELVGTKTDDEN